MGTILMRARHDDHKLDGSLSDERQTLHSCQELQPDPYSAPKGEVIWRHNGPVDGEELRGKILAYMGAFYKP